MGKKSRKKNSINSITSDILSYWLCVCGGGAFQLPIISTYKLLTVHTNSLSELHTIVYISRVYVRFSLASQFGRRKKMVILHSHITCEFMAIRFYSYTLPFSPSIVHLLIMRNDGKDDTSHSGRSFNWTNFESSDKETERRETTAHRYIRSEIAQIGLSVSDRIIVCTLCYTIFTVCIDHIMSYNSKISLKLMFDFVTSRCHISVTMILAAYASQKVHINCGVNNDRKWLAKHVCVRRIWMHLN